MFPGTIGKVRSEKEKVRIRKPRVSSAYAIQRPGGFLLMQGFESLKLKIVNGVE